VIRQEIVNKEAKFGELVSALRPNLASSALTPLRDNFAHEAAVP